MSSTQAYAEEIVSNYFSDGDVENVIKKLEEMGVDIHDEDAVVANFEEACTECGLYLYENLRYELDNDCIYYSDCVDIIKNRNYWSGWRDLAHESGLDAFDDVCQVAFAILEQEFFDEHGMEESGRYFFNTYLNREE